VRLITPPSVPDSGDPVKPLAAARRLRREKIVAASAGVDINHAKRRRLAQQMHEDQRQNRVLMHVGEVAGVKSVAIILQARRLPFAEFVAELLKRQLRRLA
jgi:hypothetical protein